MGYYTDYEIGIEKHNSLIDVTDDEFVETIVNRLNEISDYVFDDDLTLYGAKWYDWEEHIKKLSSEFPSVLFIVDGVGEENGDVWRGYFTDGKSQIEKARIQFLPFDESKLK